MNFQLENRVAVVTGGSSGIGFETLKLLLAEGAKVAFCGRDPDKLAGAEASLRADFPQAEIRRCAATCWTRSRWRSSPLR